MREREVATASREAENEALRAAMSKSQGVQAAHETTKGASDTQGASRDLSRMAHELQQQSFGQSVTFRSLGCYLVAAKSSPPK
jgi:hypothetical protein